MRSEHFKLRLCVAVVTGIWAITGDGVFSLMAWLAAAAAAVFYGVYTAFKHELRAWPAVLLFAAVLLGLHFVGLFAAVLLMVRRFAVNRELPPPAFGDGHVG